MVLYNLTDPFIAVLFEILKLLRYYHKNVRNMFHIHLEILHSYFCLIEYFA